MSLVMLGANDIMRADFPMDPDETVNRKVLCEYGKVLISIGRTNIGKCTALVGVQLYPHKDTPTEQLSMFIRDGAYGVMLGSHLPDMFEFALLGLLIYWKRQTESATALLDGNQCAKLSDHGHTCIIRARSALIVAS